MDGTRTGVLRIAVIIAASALAVLAGACGGGDDGADATATRGSETARPSVTRAAPRTPSPAASATTGIAATDTPAPAATSTPAPSNTQPPPPPTNTPVPPPPPGETTVAITGRDVRFVERAPSAPAGNLTIVFNNEDAGIVHNIRVYNGPNTDAPSIAASALVEGPITQTLPLGTLGSGAYFYRCDAHPQTMTGTLTLQ